MLHSFQPKSNKVNVLDWNVRNVVCLLGCEERSILARRPRPKFHAAVHGRTNVPMVTPNRSGRTGTFLHNEKKNLFVVVASLFVFFFYPPCPGVGRRLTAVNLSPRETISPRHATRPFNSIGNFKKK